MKQKSVVLVILILSLAVLTSCWDRRELNELGIVIGAGIDKVGDQYLLTIQFVNPSEMGKNKGVGGGRTPVTTYQAKGETIFKAARRITTMAPRILFWSHLEMLIFGEDLAREGIKKTLDVFNRVYQIRNYFDIVVVKGGKASDVLKIITPLEKIPAQNLFYSLERSERMWAATVKVKLDQLTHNLVTKGKDPVLTALVEIKEKQIDSPVRWKYQGMGVFRKDKLVGWLNEDETKGFNYLTDGGVKSTVVQFPCSKGSKERIGIEVIRTHTKTKGKVEDRKSTFDVNVRVNSNIVEIQCADIDITKKQMIDKLEKGAEQDIQMKIEQALKKARALKADIFGFGEEIHRSDPKTWEKIRNSWENRSFLDAKVKVKVKVKIRRVGKVMNSPLKETQ